MSLTLQDAQHVSWKIFKKVEAMSESMAQRVSDPTTLASDLLQKARVIATAVNELEKSTGVEKQKDKPMLAKELDDLLYYVFVLAEHYGLSLEESFLEHVNDNLLKLLT